MRCTPTVNVDRLKPYFEPAGEAPAPGPVSDAGHWQEGEHEAELLLGRPTSRPGSLARWWQAICIYIRLGIVC